MKTRKVLAALGVAGAVAGGVALAAPADAYPGFYLPGPGACNYPGISGGGAFMGFGGSFCDYPPVMVGSHYHCEWISAMFQGGGCSWRWADNTMAPVPPPEQIFW